MFDMQGESWPMPLLKGEEKGAWFKCSPSRKIQETSFMLKVIFICWRRWLFHIWYICDKWDYFFPFYFFFTHIPLLILTRLLAVCSFHTDSSPVKLIPTFLRAKSHWNPDSCQGEVFVLHHLPKAGAIFFFFLWDTTSLLLPMWIAMQAPACPVYPVVPRQKRDTRCSLMPVAIQAALQAGGGQGEPDPGRKETPLGCTCRFIFVPLLHSTFSSFLSHISVF